MRAENEAYYCRKSSLYLGLWNSEFVSFVESCDSTQSKNYQFLLQRQTNMAAWETRYKLLLILGTVSICKLAITSLWRQKQFIGLKKTVFISHGVRAIKLQATHGNALVIIWTITVQTMVNFSTKNMWN